jgi:hypothetical protein
MTQLSWNCPNCGAKVTFRWAGSVQTVCGYCKSVLVRTDIALEKIGQVAQFPSDSSPIQIGTEGVYGKRPFVAIGRIVYEYDQGRWNEWHLMMDDGASGWLSDAQLEYAVTFAVSGQTLPRECKVGQQYAWNNQTYTVSSITKAHYSGVEGELPFRSWGRSDALFVDLMSQTDKFATIDYSEDPPLLFIGEYVDFDGLNLKNLRAIEGWS